MAVGLESVGGVEDCVAAGKEIGAFVDGAWDGVGCLGFYDAVEPD